MLEEKIEDKVVMRLVRLNSTVQGIATGLALGLAIFVATNWLILKGGDVVGPHLALLGQFFIGYDVTFVGSPHPSMDLALGSSSAIFLRVSTTG